MNLGFLNGRFMAGRSDVGDMIDNKKLFHLDSRVWFRKRVKNKECCVFNNLQMPTSRIGNPVKFERWKHESMSHCPTP